MANVQLADIYNPLTFARRTQEAQLQLNRFIASGIAVQDSLIADQIASGGNLGEITNFKPLTLGEPNYSSDVPGTLSTPQKVSNQVQRFRSSQRNNSWSVMDLARDLAFDDPVAAITGRIGAFWATDDEQRIISSLLGILAENIANDAGDMVVDVSNDSSSAVSDAERVSAETIINTLQTLGDHKANVSTIAVHSAIHARLQKNNLIQYIRDSDNNIMFETYLTKRLIVDDSLPAVMGSNRITYTCMLFGPGVLGTASGRVLMPSETFRTPAGGNGGGMDTLWSRVHNVWHPYGFTFLSGSVAGQSPTYAELKNTANWDRIINRKNIPLAFLKVND
jgi:hypothetical protein